MLDFELLGILDIYAVTDVTCDGCWGLKSARTVRTRSLGKYKLETGGVQNVAYIDGGA